MKFNLEKFVTKKSARKLRKCGLHKIAAAMERAKGEDVDELNLPTAITLLGKKAYYKRASFSNIAKGLIAFKDITKEV